MENLRGSPRQSQVSVKNRPSTYPKPSKKDVHSWKCGYSLPGSPAGSQTGPCKCAGANLPKCTCKSSGPCTCQQRILDVLQACICGERDKETAKHRPSSGARRRSSLRKRAAPRDQGVDKPKVEDKPRVEEKPSRVEDKKRKLSDDKSARRTLNGGDKDKKREKPGAKKTEKAENERRPTIQEEADERSWGEGKPKENVETTALNEEKKEAVKSKEKSGKSLQQLEKELNKLQSELDVKQKVAQEEASKVAKFQKEADEFKSKLQACKEEENTKQTQFKNEKSEIAQQLKKEKEKVEVEKKQLRATMEQEKAELKKKMDEEAEKSLKAQKEAEEKIKQEQKNMTKKIGQAESSQILVQKQSRQENATLITTVERKDNELRRLAFATEILADTIRNLDEVQKKLKERYDDIIKICGDIQRANDDLTEDNTNLIIKVKDLHEKYTSQKSVTKNLHDEVAECRAQCAVCSAEVEKLKEKLRELSHKQESHMEKKKLQEKLQELRDREKKWLDEAAYIEIKIQEMDKKQSKTIRSIAVEMNTLVKNHKILQNKFDNLREMMVFTREEHKNKMNVMQAEFESLQKETQMREDKSRKKNEVLRADLQVLQGKADKDKKVLDMLSSRTKKQEIGVKIQNETINIRNCQYNSYCGNRENLKQMKASLEQLIDTNTKKVEDVNGKLATVKEEKQTLSQELSQVEAMSTEKTKQLSVERANHLEISNVVLQKDAQKHTLREELEVVETEVKKEDEKKQQLTAEEASVAAKEKELIEKKQKKEKQVAAKKEAAKSAVDGASEKSFRSAKSDATTSEFTTATSTLDEDTDSPESSQKQIIQVLERQICLVQEEASVQIKMINKQKFNALRTAKFANHALMEIVEDFKGQMCMNKDLQIILTKFLYEQEEELRKVIWGLILNSKCSFIVKYLPKCPCATSASFPEAPRKGSCASNDRRSLSPKRACTCIGVEKRLTVTRLCLCNQKSQIATESNEVQVGRRSSRQRSREERQIQSEVTEKSNPREPTEPRGSVASKQGTAGSSKENIAKRTGASGGDTAEKNADKESSESESLESNTVDKLEDMEGLLKKLKEQLAANEQQAKEAEKKRAATETLAKGFLKKLQACKAEGESQEAKRIKEREEIRKEKEQTLISLEKGKKELEKKLAEEKQTLSSKLEDQIRVNKEIKDNTMKKAEKEEQSLSEVTDKVEKIVKSTTKKLKTHAADLVSSAELKERRIKDLTACSESLKDNIKVKESGNKKLDEAIRLMRINCVELQFFQKKLCDDNTTLQHDFKIYTDKLQEEKNVQQKLTKQCIEFKQECVMLKDEVQKLKDRIHTKQGSQSLREKLEEQLQEARDREKQLKDEVAEKTEEMWERKDKEVEKEKRMEESFAQLKEDHKKLEDKHNTLMKEYEVLREDYRQEVKDMEEQYKNYALEMKTLQEEIKREYENLEKEFSELETTSKANRSTVEGLIQKTQDLDKVLKEQRDVIAAKEAENETVQTEISILHSQTADLNQECNALEAAFAEAEQMIGEVENQKEIISKSIAKTTELIDLKEQQIDVEKSKIEQVKATLQQQEAWIQSLQDEITTVQNTLTGKRQEVANRTTVLEEKMDAQKAMQLEIEALEAEEKEIRLATETQASVSGNKSISGKTSVPGKGTVTKKGSVIGKASVAAKESIAGKPSVGSKTSGVSAKVSSSPTEQKPVEPGAKQIKKGAPGGGDARQDMIVVTLEKKLELVKKWAEVEKDIATKQKDEALNTASYATNKLIQACCDFQYQIAVNKGIEALLEKIVSIKEKKCMYLNNKENQNKKSCFCATAGERVW